MSEVAIKEVPTASILRINDEKVLQLLDYYRQEECLWNTNNEYYKDQMHRRYAAEKIANLLDIPNFGPRHVIMKFKNLRNAYSQEQKKIARSGAAGMSYRPSVFWYQKMDSFIKPHLQKARRRGGQFSRSSLVCHVDGSEEWLQINSPDTQYLSKPEETSENDSNDSQSRKRKSQNTPTWATKVHKLDSDSDEPKFIEISIPQPFETNINEGNSKIDQSVKDYIDEQQKTVLKSFRDLSTSFRALAARNDDVFDNFGKYIAGLLRNLPLERALEVQPRIINLVTAAGLEHIGNVKTGQDCATVVVKVEKC